MRSEHNPLQPGRWTSSHRREPSGVCLSSLVRGAGKETPCKQSQKGEYRCLFGCHQKQRTAVCRSLPAPPEAACATHTQSWLPSPLTERICVSFRSFHLGTDCFSSPAFKLGSGVSCLGQNTEQVTKASLVFWKGKAVGMACPSLLSDTAPSCCLSFLPSLVLCDKQTKQYFPFHLE